MSLVPVVVDKEIDGERSYDIFSRLLKERIVFISGEINDSLANTVVASLLYLDSINHDDISIYITHGNEHSMKKNEKFLDREGVLVYGHEHVPYIKRMKDMVYINVGSISFPREGNLPTYMIYEDKTFTIYDIEGMLVDKITVDN